MRSRLKVYLVLLVFMVLAAAPSDAANWVTSGDEAPVMVRLREWRERLPELVKRVLKFTPKSTGDQLSPPLPKP
jgi:hypothetical protein